MKIVAIAVSFAVPALGQDWSDGNYAGTGSDFGGLCTSDHTAGCAAGYKRMVAQSCDGRNELGIFSDNLPIASCAARCTAESNCISFEYSTADGTHCQLSTSCNQDKLDYTSDNPYEGMDVFMKECSLYQCPSGQGIKNAGSTDLSTDNCCETTTTDKSNTDCKAILFVNGMLNSKWCPAGTSRLASQSDCSAASTALGKTYQGLSLQGPKGCYLADNKYVYFRANLKTHSADGKYVYPKHLPNVAPICRKANVCNKASSEDKDKGKCSANEIMSCIPCKAGQHPDGQGKLCLDDKCHCINGVASSPPQEWMLTNPSALAKACTSNGANQCSACFQGYFPHGSHCWSNTCHCKNGVGTTAAACSSNGAQQCSSCDQGYWLHGKECKIKICHCMDGRGFRGKRCPSHHSNKCEKCSEDYHIVGITCEEDEVLAMAGVNCHCLNGRGARGANCPRHNASICESCAEGHHLLGFTCVEDVEEVSLVASVTAPPTQPAAMQLDEPELNEPEGPYAENKHKEAKSTRLLDNEVARGVTYGFVGAAVGSVATVAVMSFDKEKKLSEPLLA